MALYTIFTTFNQWDDGRNVNVNRNDNDWNDNWWFAGLRNSLHFSLDFVSGEFLIFAPQKSRRKIFNRVSEDKFTTLL